MCHDRGPRGVTIEGRGVSQSRSAVCRDRGARCVAIEGRGVSRRSRIAVCHDRESRCRGDRGSRCVTIEDAIEDRGVAIEDRGVAIEDRGVAIEDRGREQLRKPSLRMRAEGTEGLGQEAWFREKYVEIA